MKRCIQTDVVVHVMELLTGEKIRSIEAAKLLIAHPELVDPDLLAKVIVDPGYKLWSKIMSAYVLGFVPMDAKTKHHWVLRKTLADGHASVQLRAHAAEALANLKDTGAAALFRERLLDERESTSVRKWCIYALAELGTSSARAALKSFASTRPQGTLAQELKSAGIALS